jgi:hypothetical protein
LLLLLLLLLLLRSASSDRRRDGRTAAAGGGAAGLLLLLLLLTPDTAKPLQATLLTLTSLGGKFSAEPKALPNVFKNELRGCKQRYE